MSREAASSRMAAVDGPKATRSAWRRKALNSVSKSKPSSGVDEVVDEAHRELAGGDADGLVGVAVDDVVVAGPALDRAGLAAARVVAGQGLQLQRDVLGDVAEPGALVEPLDEAAAAPERAGVALEPGDELDELVGEARAARRWGTPRGCRGRRRGGWPAGRTRCWGRGRSGSRGSSGPVGPDLWGWVPRRPWNSSYGVVRDVPCGIRARPLACGAVRCAGGADGTQ